ncbi:MAG: HD domain-containing protein [Candidatus Omnitrophica bacterium]|nr:HD domain-containing protein [Candidatus Omnitrophota bacterium]
MRLKDTIRLIPYLSSLKSIAAKLDADVYLVGGFLRDFYLGDVKMCRDFDFIVAAGAFSFAQEFAKKTDSKIIVLDDDEKTYRVILKKAKTHYYYDFAQMRGNSLDEDLRLRDFPLNTLSVRLGRGSPIELYDPLGGKKDIARKLIRVADKNVLKQDPLRILRAFSLSVKYGLRIEPLTFTYLGQYRKLLKKVSPERVNEELFKILGCEKCYPVIKKMADQEILDEILPGLKRCRGVTQEGGFHHLDVFDHSLETLLRFEMMYSTQLARRSLVKEYLDQELAKGRRRIQIIKLACLLHDIGKPRAKKRKDKKTIFHQHEKFGSRMSEEIAEKLKFSVKEKESLKKLVFWHLRPGYLADIRLPSRRAVYRFFRDSQDDGIGIILLSLADWRATRGPKTSEREKIQHEKVMFSLLRQYFAEKGKKPLRRVLDGYDVMKKFKIAPSPLVGDILSVIYEEQALGKITHKKDAYALAAKLIAKKRGTR